jgi:hypothetical protein
VGRLEVFDQQIDVFGETAVVNYGFEIDYEMQGAAMQDSGTDLYVLGLREGRWQVVWRTLIMDG